jgi:hypothetical protein
VIRIVHVEARTATIGAVPPDEPRGERDVPVELNEVRVRFEPVLTPPWWPDELEDAHDDAYNAFADALLPVTHGVGARAHLLLGHPTAVQWDPREPGEINLLHLDWDEQLGFMYGDAGDVMFSGAPEDILAGRWERVKAEPNSY